MSPEGKLTVVEIPGWQMIQDWAQNVREAFAEKQNDPSVARYEIVRGFADFVRLAAQIQAKAMIRKEITGSEYPAERPAKTKRSKREEIDRSKQKMTLTRVGDHWHVEYCD
jgi:hypothetical protein